MKIFRKKRRIQLKKKQPGAFRKYVVYALGEIVLVVIGILIALGINNLNQKRIDKDREKIIAQAVLKQMKRDLAQIEEQLTYMESEEEIYELILTERELTPDEKIQRLQKARFLVTTGFRILNLENKVVELLKQRTTTSTEFSNLMDQIEVRYVDSKKKLSISEDIIVNELLNNLNYIKENYDWYYKLVSHGDLDVTEQAYFNGANYRNRVAHMNLVAMDGYQYDIYELSIYLCKYINSAELALE